MSIRDYNYQLREQVEWTETLNRPVIRGADNYRALGHTITQTADGPLDAVRAELDRMAAAATMEARMSATLTRKAGGSYMLRVTWTDYEPLDESGEGGEDGEGKPGETAEQPSISVNTTATLEPLLTHPNYAALRGDIPTLQALKMLMDGAQLGDEVRDPDNPEQMLGTIADLTNGSLEAQMAKAYILAGQTEYYNPKTVLTARYRVDSYDDVDASKACTICAPPGGYPTPEGRDWMCMGVGIETSGDGLWVSETYELSGPNGWDPNHQAPHAT